MSSRVFYSFLDSFLFISQITALFILFCCLLIHCSNHFYLHIPCANLSKSKNPLLALQRRRERNDPYYKKCLTCCGILRSSEAASFNFYSILFSLYIILITIVSILLCIANSQKRYFENRLSFGIYIAHHMFTRYFFGERNALLSHGFTSDLIEIMITCCVLSLALMESFINYYRYFSTTYGVKHFTRNVRIFSALKTFSLYCIIYLVLCTTQIFFIYWLFPIIILMHIGCNYFWISQFSKLLIVQYDTCSEVKNTRLADINRITKHSLIGFLFSALIIASYNMCPCMNLSFIFPIIWSFSIMNYFMIFSRNRQWIRNRNYKCSAVDNIEDKISSPTLSSAPRMEMVGSTSNAHVSDIAIEEKQSEKNSTSCKFTKSVQKTDNYCPREDEPKQENIKSNENKKIKLYSVFSEPLVNKKKFLQVLKLNKNCNSSSSTAILKSKMIEEFNDGCDSPIDVELKAIFISVATTNSQKYTNAMNVSAIKGKEDEISDDFIFCD